MISELSEMNEDEKLKALKERADLLGISYGANIGSETLMARITEHEHDLNQDAEPDTEPDTGAGDDETGTVNEGAAALFSTRNF
jgi:hypothetical protein